MPGRIPGQGRKKAMWTMKSAVAAIVFCQLLGILYLCGVYAVALLLH